MKKNNRRLIFRNNIGSRSISSVGIDKTSKHQPVNSSTNNTSRSLSHLCVWERLSKHFSYQLRDVVAASFPARTKGKQCHKSWPEDPEQKMKLLFPPLCLFAWVNSTRSEPTGGLWWESLLTRQLTGLLMRPVDWGASMCMCRLVGCAQMDPERCTYELKPQ